MISSLASDQIIFATAGYDHTIRFWNPNTGQCYRVLQHNESVMICFLGPLFLPLKRRILWKYSKKIVPLEKRLE